MSDFAPELRHQEPNEYLRLSQGWRDNSVGTLISGLGDFLKVGVKALDERNLRNITDEATAAVDETRDRAIVELHDVTRNPPPKEIANDMRRLTAYKAAVDSGSARESNYWGALDSTARRLRARYPGYREHIDQEMKRLTGQDPANALVRELRQDWAQLNRASGDNDPEKRKFALLEAYTKEFGNLPPDWQNMNYAQVMEMYSNESRKKYALEQRKAMLSLAREQNTYDREQTREVASADWGTKLRSHLNGSGTMFANSMNRIRELEQAVKARGGFAPTPEETQQFIAASQEAASILTRDFISFVNTPQPHLGGKSYAQTLSREQLAELKANQLDNIVNDIQSAVTNKDFGWAYRAAMMSEIYSDSEKARLLGNDTLRKLGAARAILGDVGAGLLYNTISNSGRTYLTDVQEALRQDAVIRMADPTDPVSMAAALDKIGNKGEAKPQVAQEVINSSLSLMTNTDVPIANRLALVNSMYGPDNETFLALVNRNPRNGGNPEAPQRVFQLMANSNTAKAIDKLAKETGDPTVWDKYERWVTSQVYALNTLDINTVAGAQVDATAMDIKFNPSTMTFSVTERTPTPASRPGESVGIAVVRGLANAYESNRLTGVQEAVRKINLSMAPLRDIADIRGVDKTEYALAVLSNLGLRLESKYGREAVSQSLITKLSEYLYSRPEVTKPPKGYKPDPNAPDVGKWFLRRLLRPVLGTPEEADTARNRQ